MGFNIKDNGIRYYNFDIVPYFELSILLLQRESHIATCGAKGSGDPDPSDIKPKTHAEE